MQETYLRALRGWRSYRPGTNLAAWLATILRNAYLDEARRRSRRPARSRSRTPASTTSTTTSRAGGQPQEAVLNRLTSGAIVESL